MINYIEKGSNLHIIINNAGYTLKPNTNDEAYDSSGQQSVAIDLTVQAIIDNYNPLPIAQKQTKLSVKEATANARARYVSGGAGKDAEYTLKAQEAKQFNIDGAVGVFMQGRMDATSETAETIAEIWNTNSANWQLLGGKIAGLEDKAINDINAETNWQSCIVIADAAIVNIDKI